MSESRTTTVEGHVGLVQFRPYKTVFLSICFDEQGLSRYYQIDGAKLSVDGQSVSALILVTWLAQLAGELPRAKLTGRWGPGTYEMCDSAEFFSAEVVAVGK